MPFPPTSSIAGDLVTSCTIHICELSKLFATGNEDLYRTPLRHEFGRFRLWAHDFYRTPPATGNILDEVLEETVFLKEPTILLLATFARLLLAGCLHKVGNVHTRTLLEQSLHAVIRSYPHLEASLQREWNTQDTAIADLRECVDALFDLVSTLDDILEEMQERLIPVGKLVNLLVLGRDPLLIGEDPAVDNTPEIGGLPVGGHPLAVHNPLLMGGDVPGASELLVTGTPHKVQDNLFIQGDAPAAGDSLPIGQSLSVGGVPEMLDPPDIEDPLWVDIEEPASSPIPVTSMDWEITQQHIRDRSPQATEELDIEDLARGDVVCHGRPASKGFEIMEVRASSHMPTLLGGTATQFLPPKDIVGEPNYNPAWGVTGSFKAPMIFRTSFEGMFKQPVMKDREQALQLSELELLDTPPGHPLRVRGLMFLSTQLGHRFEQVGNLKDLERAIHLSQEAVEGTPSDHPMWAELLIDLSIELGNRFERSGDLEDLEQVIHWIEVAATETPPGHPLRAHGLMILSSQLRSRFKNLGKPEDLERAIQLEQEAVPEIPPDHPHRARIFLNLRAWLGHRFERIRDLKDLERTIQWNEELVKEAPPGHPLRVRGFMFLSTQLGHRFERVGNLKDLDRAIQLAKEAVTEIHPGHPFYTIILMSLSSQLGSRFKWLGIPENLEQAIQLNQEAGTETPHNNPTNFERLKALSAMSVDRSDRLRGVQDLQRAIQQIEEAVTATPPDNSDRAGMYKNLGTMLRRMYSRLGDLQDLQ